MCEDKSVPEGTPPICNDTSFAKCSDGKPRLCNDGTSGVAKVIVETVNEATGEKTKTVNEGSKTIVESTRQVLLCPDGEAPVCGDNSTARTCTDKSNPMGSPLICKDGAQPNCAASGKPAEKCAGAATATVTEVKT